MNKPRLIDANELLEDMKRLCGKDCGVCDYSTFLASDEHCGLIDNQPTAYDVDKVVEQLEAELYNELEPIKTAFNFGINKAIEIVKGGGNENSL